MGMNRHCSQYCNRLVDLLEGRPDAEATQHLEGCEFCRKRYQQLSKIMQGMAVEVVPAPSSLVLNAQEIVSSGFSRMTFIRSSLQQAFARTTTEDFQAVFGSSDLELRVMYTKLDLGWEVVCRTPDPHWTVQHKGKALRVDDEGGVHFVSVTLEDTGFKLQRFDLKLEVPSGLEAINESRLDS